MAATNRGTELLWVNIAFFVLAACTVLMRCYTRAFISKCFGPDDWLMAVSCAFFLGYVICSNIGIGYGTGQHRADLTPENYATAKRCNPVAHYWNDAIPGRCIPLHVYVGLGYLYSAVSVLTDLIFALLPAFIIWHLQIRSDIRYILILLMGLGCVASIAVLVRVAYLHTFFDPDFLYATTDIAIWSTIEMGLALTAASFSTLRPLARSLGFKIGFTDYASAGSESVNHNDARRQSKKPAHRRQSRPPIRVLSAPGTSQDTLNERHTRDKSNGSQVTARPAGERATWPAIANIDVERAMGGLELAQVDGAMDHSTSSRVESKTAS
ncbi:integral membrane protein, putative [Cordyceps militaris CM01]|uniref:Integral membrane protein, putative n=1 Tax=Cordyceps militaris (strain CM01) TaxID=983644 RepID=G3JL12_CORMM|nr:integral membrane protein, putative [Cordyceps militaris CM01]EGX90386.1 integral membrane protein, putative [Cordyceps militaris CM01]